MSRSTQFIGHSPEVSDFLNECKQGKKIGEVLGMFDENVYNLHQFQDSKGKIWEEFIQAEPWASGPVIFLAIKNKKKIKGWDVKYFCEYE